MRVQFYGIMGLSMRDAVHQIQVRNEDELLAQIFHPNTSWDRYHPTCIGSRWVFPSGQCDLRLHMQHNPCYILFTVSWRIVWPMGKI